ncbi:mechanosensitive ion channel protein 5-like [Ananas comosus]|uniref:Mechanosensitive ion channel protein n=1 Tax=Ananas comosus TaxID=4615 RepID=A0A6P5FM40_ANACO|nr:mechanosensitive ion channel protein 5-like [Ananas comosus]
MDSLRKPKHSYGGSSRFSSSSRAPSFEHAQEDRPMLVDDHHRDEVVVKIDGNSRSPFDPPTPSSTPKSEPAPNANLWREGSYDFWREAAAAAAGGGGNGGGGGGGGSNGFSFRNRHNQKQGPNLNPVAESGEDPPSRLISSFLRKQRASGAEVSLDMDIETDELRKQHNSSSSREYVSLENSSACKPSSSSTSTSGSSSDNDEVVGEHRSDHNAAAAAAAAEAAAASEAAAQSSNREFRRSPSLARVKTRSRLLDPSPRSATPANSTNSTNIKSNDNERRSERTPNKSGMMRSGMLGNEEDEDDPFLDDDIPDEFKRGKIGALTILQWLSLLLIVAALVCNLAIPVLQDETLWHLHLWKWELLGFVLICGRLVSGWFIRVVVFFFERNFLLRKRVLYFVYGVRKAVQNCLWLGLVLLSWHFMFDKKVERETHSTTLPYVTKVLVCLLIATLLRLVKTLLLKVLASSFHVSTYFDRIQDALFNQYVVETLSGPPLIEAQQEQYEEDRMMADLQKLQNAGATLPNDLKAATLPNKSGQAAGVGGQGGAVPKSGQIGGIKLSWSGGSKQQQQQQEQQQEDVIRIDQLHKLNQKNISAWNMKRLMKMVRYGTLTTLHEKIPQATGGEDDSTMKIRSEYEAKVAARKIFKNVARPGSKYIYLSDLLRFMRQEEAERTMNLFEGAKEKDRISRKCLKNWVVNAFRERRALALTLNDTKTAVNKLNNMANVVVGFIVFALSLLILGLATTHFFVFLSSQLLLAVFMFGNTLKTIFEAIIFLFVMHPFDVGDRCEVEGVQLVVEEMNIMTTVFLRYDNLKIYFPNSILATKPISNYYRSPDMGDAIDFCVHVATPVEKLAVMKERILKFMESKKEHWHPNPMIVLRDVDDMNRLKISIWMQHRINHHDMGMRFQRRELVVQEMIRVLRELEIEYRMLPVDLNVRQMPPVNSARLPSTWLTFN